MTTMENAESTLDTKYIVQTLLEENREINENRIFLVATLKQLKAEYAAEKEKWAAEKASLLKTK